MKIAVYGCSFASESPPTLTNKKGKGWATILREEYNRDVTNFGLLGSGIYYSYSKFKETHHNFDKVIFLASESSRIYCPNLSVWQHASMHYDIKDDLSKEVKDMLRKYYSYIHNQTEKEDMKDLMIADILKIRPDSLYIDSFSTLILVSHLDSGPVQKKYSSCTDPRYCHINNRNNYILAQKINDWLSGTPFIFDIKDFEAESQSELEKYYEQ